MTCATLALHLRKTDLEYLLVTQPNGVGEFLDARKARLSDILEGVGIKKLTYLYDFVDGWEHSIKVERLIDPEPGVLYPRPIEVCGRCPPEDCGGPWGYAELLEAIKDPTHECHAKAVRMPWRHGRRQRGRRH
jgi:hypothetical protein